MLASDSCRSTLSLSGMRPRSRVSDAIMRKYVQWPKDARAMVRDEVLATTLRLHPAETS
jgi:hypothetical protein